MAIGTFDGVHLGHHAILDHLKKSASQLNGESVVLTFHPHPRMVLHPEDHGLQLLSTQAEKIALIEAAGIHHMVILPFTAEFSKVEPFEYVRDLLVNGIGARRVIAGHDHRFGRNREGDLETLRQLAESFNFEVEEIPPHVIDQVKVSSTKIRESLKSGDVTVAEKFLGYRYSISGKVEHGERFGRKIGFPTANIRPDDALKLIPANGVYAVRVFCKEKNYLGALNIGVRPTVSNQNNRTIEVHILDYTGELYGENIRIEFVSRIRDELKFDSVEELRTAIENDIRWTQDFFRKQK